MKIKYFIEQNEFLTLKTVNEVSSMKFQIVNPMLDPPKR